jgi:hypothetical protein
VLPNLTQRRLEPSDALLNRARDRVLLLSHRAER